MCMSVSVPNLIPLSYACVTLLWNNKAESVAMTSLILCMYQTNQHKSTQRLSTQCMPGIPTLPSVSG